VDLTAPELVLRTGRNPEVFGERVDCVGQDIGGAHRHHPRPRPGRTTFYYSSTRPGSILMPGPIAEETDTFLK
jgi:hypothetical protein